ncbi:hypothetical protein PLESTB_000754800 [Pleodorina starrii]|uniref:Uncharacterized protein n=1 Tax=Pleodorina starrii TaxID=330485 RepID=A0A9W6BKL9_9CHLO|nr:hypothetical protein PLESTM_001570600 [Pleodorina starrii]GLC53485.1 hypothetical protein PLESTB_000754800 [Pleodorina starrii]GLC69778.1 hypothetical protein PLESTF_000879700 [Pleodorina starrii]
MGDRDEDVGVDFTGHFMKCSDSKQHKKKQRNSDALAVTKQLPARKHAKGKQHPELVSKRDTKGQKRKTEAANLQGGGDRTKKRKADGAHDEECDGRPPALAKQRVDKEFWSFEVDYNDHFETSKEAVQDIEPILHVLSKKLKKSPSKLAIYDPFFCKGGIRRHYEQLGFNNFIHRNRDFYQDVDSGNLPPYDILVTNPPYSADHKERILEFCLRSGKPWALLLPNYVATKAYFSELLDTSCTAPSQRPFFLTPRVRYSYDHPEGTGHTESPFFSIWYIGLGEHTEAAYGTCKARLDSAATAGAAAAAGAGAKRHGGTSGGGGGGGGGGSWNVSLARTVDTLRSVGAVPTARRLNPKQRARLKQHKAQS